MELNISITQLKELTPIQRINLSSLLGYETGIFLNFFKNNNDLEKITEVITIGKILEILKEKYHAKLNLVCDNQFILILNNKKDTPFIGKELIDILWNILKFYL